MPANAGLPPGIHWGYRCARVPRSSRPSSSRPSSPVARRLHPAPPGPLHHRALRDRSHAASAHRIGPRVRGLRARDAEARDASSSSPAAATATLPPGDPIPDAFAGRYEPLDSGDVAVDSKGNVYTDVGQAIWRFDPSGKLTGRWFVAYPGTLVIDASDRIFWWEREPRR